MHYVDGMRSSYFDRLISGNIFALSDRFNQEITRQFYKQAPFVSISLFFVLGVFYYYFQGILPDTLLSTWVGINVFLCVLLLLAYLAFRHFSQEADTFTYSSWLKAYVVLLLLQDLSLGMLGPMTTMVSDETSRLLILFILAGMAAGAIATRGILLKTYLLSVTCLLLPIAVTLAVADYPMASVMLVLTVVFYLFLLSVGKNYSESISRNIRLWLNLEQEVDAHKQTEAELRLAKQKAEAASETKNQFLANVSHEIRTPLNGIVGFSSALINNDLDETASNYVRRINSCSRTLLNMFNDILDVTTIEAGHLELREYPFELMQEIDEVVALAQQLSKDKGLNFRYRQGSRLTNRLFGDGQRLKQVINNFISNAVKYTERGEIILTVNAKPLDENRSLLTVTIEDTGIGIPRSAHATLFDSFTQVRDFKTRRTDGVGLGLSIANDLVQQMHGSILFESEEGKGSKFEVSIPFAHQAPKSDASAEETADNKEVTKLETATDIRRLKILVVDDNELNRLVIKAFLDPYQVNYTEATGGEEALKLLESDHYDVVLLDINMPDLSGTEVHKRYCENHAYHPYFIAVTAHAFQSEVSKLLEAGFNDCLIKPISGDDLIGQLKQVAANL